MAPTSRTTTATKQSTPEGPKPTKGPTANKAMQSGRPRSQGRPVFRAALVVGMPLLPPTPPPDTSNTRQPPYPYRRSRESGNPGPGRGAWRLRPPHRIPSSPPHVPAKAGIRASRLRSPSSLSRRAPRYQQPSPARTPSTVVPAKAGIQRCAGRGTPPPTPIASLRSRPSHTPPQARYENPFVPERDPCRQGLAVPHTRHVSKAPAQVGTPPSCATPRRRGDSRIARPAERDGPPARAGPPPGWSPSHHQPSPAHTPPIVVPAKAGIQRCAGRGTPPPTPIASPNPPHARLPPPFALSLSKGPRIEPRTIQPPPRPHPPTPRVARHPDTALLPHSLPSATVSPWHSQSPTATRTSRVPMPSGASALSSAAWSASMVRGGSASIRRGCLYSAKKFLDL